ncbi:MAG: extensin family protein, partial [Brevundimonas sp.]|nr:extensin family protein [Brevundimonas sp.]
AARKDDPPPPKQPVRRFFSDEQKRAIALESDRPGVSVSAVARKHGIVTGMLFRWRVEFGITQKKRARLAPVANADEPASIAVLHDLLQPPDGMTAVELADGRRVSVLEDWPGDGPRGPEGRRFLTRIRDGACRVFSTVLTPDYNDAHANHLHLDGAPRPLCR